MSRSVIRRMAVIGVSVVVVFAAVLYFTGALGCSIPRTRIASRSLYQGATTLGSPVEDWPMWRGPRGDQISREKLPERFAQGGPRQLWSAEVGLGYASPIAAEGKIYLFSMNDEKDTLTAFDANSGKILWSQAGSAGWTSSYVGSRATPAIDGDRIYTYGGQGELICRNLSDGKERWKLNILAETGAKPLRWGMASSPLVAGGLVYVQSGEGGAIAVAVNKLDGKVAWKSQASGIGGYAHPILIDVAGTAQLIVFAGETLYALDPPSGRELWQYPWKTSFNVNSSTPIYRDGRLFATSEYDHGCIQLALSPSGATKVWENRNIEGKFQGAILDGDYLYANSAGTIVCVSWADGTFKWKSAESKLRPGIGGSMVRAGDKLLILSERGKLSLTRATPAGIELLDQAEVVDGKEVWATPVIYGGRVYAKGRQELVCLELTNAK